MRAILLAAVIAMAIPGLARADGPVSTGGDATTQPPKDDTTPPPLHGRPTAAADMAPVAIGPCGPEKVKPDGKLDTAPHGEVEAGIGTHGYRHIAGTVCKPIGDDAAITVSAGETDYGDGGRRRR